MQYIGIGKRGKMNTRFLRVSEWAHKNIFEILKSREQHGQSSKNVGNLVDEMVKCEVAKERRRNPSFKPIK